MKTYTITRYEQTGDSLFICLNSTNNPVYLEHFFTEEEKLDIQGTITKLVAELELKDTEYMAPLPVISKLEEVKNLEIKKEDITNAKNFIVLEKLRIENEKLEALKTTEEVLEVIE